MTTSATMTTNAPAPRATTSGRPRTKTHARVSALLLSAAAFGAAWTAIVRADTGPGGPLAAPPPEASGVTANVARPAAASGTLAAPATTVPR
ncbi:MAG: hypothetical protein O2895_03635, partial [Chloroflexi bacterium]|nr:hypothetical protein [Chloroflexota bacterium]